MAKEPEGMFWMVSALGIRLRIVFYTGVGLGSGNIGGGH